MHRLLTPVVRLGHRIRRLCDRLPDTWGGPITVVALCAALTAAAAAYQRHVLAPCDAHPVDMIRLEAAFTTSAFFSRLNATDGLCQAAVLHSFYPSDALFALCYGPLLAAIYLYASRWRRFDPDKRTLTPTFMGSRWRGDALVAVAVIAAVFDLGPENFSLAIAPAAGSLNPLFAAIAVFVGSLAAVTKWLLLLLSVAAILVELGAGPRGLILWRTRYSVIAALFGGVPLLAIPQGQDILQRLFEGQHQTIRLLTAVPPVLAAAVVIWYCARMLTQLQLPGALLPDGWATWNRFYAIQIPRALAVLFLAIVAIAFARAASAATWFIGVTIAAFVVVIPLRRRFGKVLGRPIRSILPEPFRRIEDLDGRVVRLIIACAIGSAILWPIGARVGAIGGAADADVRTHTALLWASYICFVFAWLFQFYIRYRRPLKAVYRDLNLVITEEAVAAGAYAAPVDTVPLMPSLRRGVAMALVVSGTVLLAFASEPVLLGRWLGPLWVLTLATANVVLMGSIAVWIGRHHRIPLVPSAIAAAFLFSFWNDNHAVARLPGTIVPSRPTVSERFDAWKATNGKSGTAGPVVLVAGSGGGLRAAYWTAMALAVLQDRHPQFGQHLFAFSGVSGGSLGGAVFAALQRDISTQRALLHCDNPDGITPPPEVGGTYAGCVRAFMADDHLTPVLAKLVAPDFLQLFLPIPIHGFDRSRALEAGWESSYRRIAGADTFSEGFLAFEDVANKETVGPILLLNATHVETGRRYISTPVLRRPFKSPTNGRFDDAGDVLQELGSDVPLSAAVHNSARFTYISPAGHLVMPDAPRELGHVVDGGYFENSGLTTVREVYDEIHDKGVEVYVLYLCNDPGTCKGPTSADEDVHSTIGDELLSPARALLRTRDARGELAQVSFRNLDEAHFLELNVCADAPPTTASANEDQRENAKARVVSPPLGWLLSKVARDWMDKSLPLDSDQTGDSCYQKNAAVLNTLGRVVTH
ncbi:MAG: hypothetical protein ABI634_20760 [Acidobacteriota bacterium]